jgi:thiol-disulfide isomerase/thioredoxin
MTLFSQILPIRLWPPRVALSLAIALPLLFSGLPGAPSAAHAEEKIVLKIGAPAPDIAFTSLDGGDYKLSQFRGRPVMLWFFASWCRTCIGSTKLVSELFADLTAGGMRIIQLRLYNNLGYAGPTARQFAESFAGAPGDSPDWLWGEASLEASVTYDPRGYPDIYFLIDRGGILRAANGAPNVSMDDILDFAGKS